MANLNKTTKAQATTFKVTTKEKNLAKRQLFFEVLLPLLEAQGFTRDLKIPFIWVSDWGWDPGASGYCYDLVRVKGHYFEYINVYIPSSAISRQFQVTLQILELKSDHKYIISTQIPFQMMLKITYNKKNLLLNPSFCSYGMKIPRLAKPSYMLKRFFTRFGYKKRIDQLKKDLIKDFTNIQPIINKWLDIQIPNIIDLNQMVIKETAFLINGIHRPTTLHK